MFWKLAAQEKDYGNDEDFVMHVLKYKNVIVVSKEEFTKHFCLSVWKFFNP